MQSQLTNEQKIEVLNLVFSKMKKIFTSNKFLSCCYRKGITQSDQNNGLTAAYLHHKCTQYNTRRTWLKNFE